MDQTSHFYPPRRLGLPFQIGMGFVFLAAAGYLFYTGLQAQAGVLFLLYLLGALACLIPLTNLIYRVYSLITGRYQLERDGLRLRWGFRFEDIPLNDIEWVRPAEEILGLVKGSLPLPWLRWPGSAAGVRQVTNLGEVEYMASQTDSLVLVATQKRIYAISPSDPQAFIQAFERLTELGSLTPLAPVSVHPVFMAGRVWQSRLARILILSALVLGLILLVWAVLAIPTRTGISLGFARGGLPEKTGPAERLLLLPVLEGLSFIGSLGLGLYFFRRPTQRAVAYMLWAGCAVQAVLLLAAMAYLVSA